MAVLSVKTEIAKAAHMVYSSMGTSDVATASSVEEVPVSCCDGNPTADSLSNAG